MTEYMFATAITCIDGRIQRPIAEWMRSRFGAEYVDMITEPGIDRAMQEMDVVHLSDLRHKTELSLNTHRSSVIAVVGHDDCAANPCGHGDHIRFVKQVVAMVQSWFPSARVLGLVVDPSVQDLDKQVEEIGI